MGESGEVILTRNIFINTELSQYRNDGSYRTTLPSSAFACKNNQKMRLTLTSFEMRKNWYEVNNMNNTFFMFCTYQNLFTLTGANSGSDTLTINGFIDINDSFVLSALIPSMTGATAATTYFVIASANYAYNATTNVTTFNLSAARGGGSVNLVGTTSTTLIGINILKTNNTNMFSLVPIIIPPGTYRAFGTSAPQVANSLNSGSVPTLPNTYQYTNNDLCSALKFAVDKALYALYYGGQVTDNTNSIASSTTYLAHPCFTSGTAAAGDITFGSAVMFNTVTRKFTITLPSLKTNATEIFSFIFPQIKMSVTY